MNSAEHILEEVGIAPTANRVLVLREFIACGVPLSLVELETNLGSMERSSILRVLRLLLDREALHSMEDGRGVTKYELCHGNHHCRPDQMHPHFYCRKCHRTFCLSDTSVPTVAAPSGFTVETMNCMLKGVCRDCREGKTE